MTKKRVFVSGHLGMAGSAIYTMLQKDQDIDLILDILSNTLDLRIRETENGEIILYREE